MITKTSELQNVGITKRVSGKAGAGTLLKLLLCCRGPLQKKKKKNKKKNKKKPNIQSFDLEDFVSLFFEAGVYTSLT
jgi:hypothetical protein